MFAPVCSRRVAVTRRICHLSACCLTGGAFPAAVTAAAVAGRQRGAGRAISTSIAACAAATAPASSAASAAEPVEQPSSLVGLAVIVSGGGTGIGQGIALALAAEGMHVVVTGRRLEPLQTTADLADGMAGSVEPFVTDIQEWDQSAVVQHVLNKHGRLDMLVNNAGTNIKNRSLADMSLKDWHTVIDTNLHGTYHMVHAVLPVMREQRDGLIINVTSISGKRTISDLAGSAYCASKFGMGSLGQAINLEEYEHGIRCTNIAPGEVVTDILDHRPVPPSEERRKQMLQPADVAAAVVMVAKLPKVAHVTEITMTGKTTVPQAVL
jgi:NADP-dependent 3-hydroxy acid dehydrogenase YdfG